MLSLTSARCRPIFALTLLLTVALTLNWALQCRFASEKTPANSHDLLRQFVPERLRSFIAARFWLKADELMHRGPFPGSRQSFMPGSYYGNADIVPLLRVVIALVPDELAPYQLLARSLVSLQGEPGDGLSVLQQGIINNPEHAACHELFAAAGWLKIFSGQKPGPAVLESAAKYLERADELFQNSSLKLSSDPAFTGAAYQTLLARVYLELARPEKAMQAWLKSGQSLDDGTDRLAEVLRYYRDHGVLPVVQFPPFLDQPVKPVEPVLSATATVGTHHHDHEQGENHADCDLCSQNDQTQKNPPDPFARSMVAGFLVISVLVLRRFIFRG